MLKILTNPHPILRQKSQPIKNAKDPEIQALIAPMTETMITADGVGLAAPQIGKNIRLIVLRHQDEDLALLNPIISQKSFLKEWGEEGCLSVPKTFGEVKRHKKVTVKYLDKNGIARTLVARGLLARAAQHEIDHLNGVLFIDKARKITKIDSNE